MDHTLVNLTRHYPKTIPTFTLVLAICAVAHLHDAGHVRHREGIGQGGEVLNRERQFS